MSRDGKGNLEGHLDFTYLDKVKSGAVKKYKKEFPNEEEDAVRGIVNDNDIDVWELEFTNSGLKMTIGTNFGWFDLEVPITDLEVIEHVVKKINRIKTTLESIK